MTNLILHYRDPTNTLNGSYDVITPRPLVQYSSLGHQDIPPTYDSIGTETLSKEERIYQVLEWPTGEGERDYYEVVEEKEDEETGIQGFRPPPSHSETIL